MKSSTIPSPTLTSNIFGAKCSPSPGKKLPGKNPVRRAFKKIQIQMIADIVYASHESSITICGHWLTYFFQELHPEVTGRTLMGLYSTEDIVGTETTGKCG